MRQGPLDFAGLTCAFSEPWMGLHPLCDAHGAEMVKQFEAAVLAGTYDADGYTPNERKAQQKRAPRTTKRTT